MENKPIGIFDSGLGGLTVLRAIHALMPEEDLVYFGDSGRAPYGTKSKETIIKYTFQDINFLLKQNVKMIVIACNTASACSLERVRASCPVPVVEVVGPGARAAANASGNGRIGVIGTPATIGSGVYEKAIREILPNCVCYSVPCPLFVPLVEEGWWENEVAEIVAEKYLAPLRDKKIDSLVLGCTHYPLLTNVIQKVMGQEVVLINSAYEVAKEVKVSLDKNGIACKESDRATVRFYTSDSVDKFAALGELFLDAPMRNSEKVEIEKERDQV